MEDTGDKVTQELIDPKEQAEIMELAGRLADATGQAVHLRNGTIVCPSPHA